MPTVIKSFETRIDNSLINFLPSCFHMRECDIFTVGGRWEKHERNTNQDKIYGSWGICYSDVLLYLYISLDCLQIDLLRALKLFVKIQLKCGIHVLLLIY